MADRLARRGMPHQDSCPLYDQHEETMQHLLVECVFARQVWHWLKTKTGREEFDPLGEDTVTSWCIRQEQGMEHKRSTRVLCLLGMWMTWKQMNDVVFNGATPSTAQCITNIEEEGKLWVKAGLLRNGGGLPWEIEE